MQSSHRAEPDQKSLLDQKKSVQQQFDEDMKKFADLLDMLNTKLYKDRVIRNEVGTRDQHSHHSKAYSFSIDLIKCIHQQGKDLKEIIAHKNQRYPQFTSLYVEVLQETTKLIDNLPQSNFEMNTSSSSSSAYTNSLLANYPKLMMKVEDTTTNKNRLIKAMAIMGGLALLASAVLLTMGSCGAFAPFAVLSLYATCHLLAMTGAFTAWLGGAGTLLYGIAKRNPSYRISDHMCHIHADVSQLHKKSLSSSSSSSRFFTVSTTPPSLGVTSSATIATLPSASAVSAVLGTKRGL